MSSEATTRYVILPSERRLNHPFMGFDPRYRIGYFENFLKKPGLTADTLLPGSDSTSPTAAQFASYRIANKEWSITGSNSTSALASAHAGGGVTLTTAGGANTTDAEVMAPIASQSAWATTQWQPDRRPVFKCWILTHTAIVAGMWQVKLAKTVALDLTTDDDQIGFQFSTTGSNSTAFTLLQSVAGTDTVPTISNAPVVAVSTNYELEIRVPGADLVPYYYINGVLVGKGAAMTSGATAGTWASLAPVVGTIQKTNSVASAVTVRGIGLSQLHSGTLPLGATGASLGMPSVS